MHALQLMSSATWTLCLMHSCFHCVAVIDSPCVKHGSSSLLYVLQTTALSKDKTASDLSVYMYVNCQQIQGRGQSLPLPAP